MPWNTVDCRFQMRFEIVREKYQNLLNNIGLTYRSLNMRIALNLFLKIEQVPVWN